MGKWWQAKWSIMHTYIPTYIHKCLTWCELWKCNKQSACWAQVSPAGDLEENNCKWNLPASGWRCGWLAKHASVAACRSDTRCEVHTYTVSVSFSYSACEVILAATHKALKTSLSTSSLYVYALPAGLTNLPKLRTYLPTYILQKWLGMRGVNAIDQFVQWWLQLCIHNTICLDHIHLTSFTICPNWF